MPAGEAVELRLGAPVRSRRGRAASRPRARPGSSFGIGSPGAPGPSCRPRRSAWSRSLASVPLTVTADGGGLRERLADFVTEVAAGPTPTAAPVTTDLIFNLPSPVSKTCRATIFELGVRLEVGGSPMAIAWPPIDGDLRAFATAFEQAWQGFDGADGRLRAGPRGRARAGYLVVREDRDRLRHRHHRPGDRPKSLIMPCRRSPPCRSRDRSTARTARPTVSSPSTSTFGGTFSSSELERLAAVSDGDTRPVRARAPARSPAPLPAGWFRWPGGAAGDGLAEARAVFESAAADDLRWRPIVIVAAGRGQPRRSASRRSALRSCTAAPSRRPARRARPAPRRARFA